jgi:hypothetical protein
MDTAASVGQADATIIDLDYRFAGDVNYAVNFIGTLSSIGTGDSVTLQVSPDYDVGAPSNAGAMWGSVEVFTSTSFNGSLNGPWTAFRFIKAGTQTAKIVGLVAGKNKNKLNRQG